MYVLFISFLYLFHIACMSQPIYEFNDLSSTFKMMPLMHSDVTCCFCSLFLPCPRPIAHPFPIFAILWIFRKSYPSTARWKTPETPKHMQLPQTLECLTHLVFLTHNFVIVSNERPGSLKLPPKIFFYLNILI